MKLQIRGWLFLWLFGIQHIAGVQSAQLEPQMHRPIQAEAEVIQPSCAIPARAELFMSAEKSRVELQAALKNAQYDDRGRLVLMKIRGRTVEPRYDGEILSGYQIGETFYAVSTDARVDKPESINLYVRDSSGSLLETIPLEHSQAIDSFSKATRAEFTFTRETALTYLKEKKLATLPPLRAKYYDYEQGVSTKPCFVCDADFNIDIGFCGVLAGIEAGAGITIAAGVCAGSVGFLCPGGALIGVAAIGAAILTYSACSERARGRYIDCRNTCN